MNIDVDSSLRNPESLVPRLGELLVKERLLEPEALALALSRQQQFAMEGKSMLLGQVLVELGLIRQETLDGVITRQIFQLQYALEKSNRELELRVDRRTEELLAALSRLTELNELKASFMSNVSHELRMPMQLLLGYLDLMTKGSLGNLSSEQADAVSTMLQASHRLRNLIEDLLTFSTMTSGDAPVNLVPISLNSFVTKAVETVAPVARTKNIAIHTQLSSEVPPVSADGDHIRWVVGQLLDNALKFTPQGGRVRVKTSPHEKHVTVSVCDTGIGIPRDQLQEIFEPFHQLDNSITRSYSGAGLGLSLAQSLLHAHGTSMTVRSRVGRGSRFAFRLPYLANKVVPST